jgi:protein-disulfide isomerase
MSEERKGSGQEGGRPGGGQGRPFPGSGGGGSAPPIGWIVSANLLALLALVIAVVALVFYITDEDEEGSPTQAAGQPTATAQPSPAVQATPTPTPVVVEASVDDDPSWGPEDAPVTIVEFSEFLCPYCQRFALQTLPQIEQAYEGEVRYVYRDFIVHGEASLKISEAAECADDQDKFWEYHDKLWEQYNTLLAHYQTVSEEPETGMSDLETTLKGYASDLGLDTATFNDCLDTGKNTAEVEKDSQDMALYAQAGGITRYGTPSFFINGLFVAGAQDFSVFQSVIDAAIEGGGSSSAVPTVPSSAGG